MAHILKIAGREISLVWDNATQRVFSARLSKIGETAASVGKSLGSSARGEYGIISILWAALPADDYRRYPTPEDMVADIDQADNAQAVEAVFGLIKDMSPSSEKKSTSRKSPSQKSS